MQYNFKVDYQPTYTAQEISFFHLPLGRNPHAIAVGNTPPGTRGVTPEPGALYDPFDPRMEAPASPSIPDSSNPPEEPSTSSSSSVSKYEGPWILNPRLKEGLGSREMYLHIQNRADFNSSKDQRVFLQTSSAGLTEIICRSSHRGGTKAGAEIKLVPADLVLDINTPKSISKLEPSPVRAAGLYIIVHPPQQAGKMARRVGHLASKWILQLVTLTKRAGRRNADRHDEHVLSNNIPLVVERDWIVPIHEVIEDCRAGNEGIEPHRGRLHNAGSSNYHDLTSVAT